MPGPPGPALVAPAGRACTYKFTDTYIHIHMYICIYIYISYIYIYITYIHTDTNTRTNATPRPASCTIVPLRAPRVEAGCGDLPRSSEYFMDGQTYPKRFLPESFEAY